MRVTHAFADWRYMKRFLFLLLHPSEAWDPWRHFAAITIDILSSATREAGILAPMAFRATAYPDLIPPT